MFKISVLGQLQIEVDGAQIPSLSTSKVNALMAYLVVENDYPHRRETLAGLLWPESTDVSARTNLRQSIARLRRIIPAEAILATRQTIRFDPDFAYSLDLTEFEVLLTRYRLEDDVTLLHQAVALYRGDFLDQLWLENSVAFEEWLLLKREWLRREMIDALYRLASEALTQQRLNEAIEFARQQLEIDSLNELAYQQLMQGLVGIGRRTEALQQYERCRLILWDELQSPPSHSTIALADQIRAGAAEETLSRHTQTNDSSTRLDVISGGPKQPHTIPHNLPHQLTPIVGRQAEIDALITRLANPDSRLVTILGAGGMGKTRLALAIAHHLVQSSGDAIQESNWPDGVYFVSLQAVPTVDGIMATIADTLGLRFSGTDAPQNQVIHYLKSKKAFLLLDNFEHLLAGAPILTALCQACPNIHFLVTSRERLDLQQEHIFSLHGLAYPQTLSEAADTYSAVQLFVKTVQRVQPDFELDAANLPFVATICQHVEGMPLALELAASWAHVMPLHDIVQNLTTSSDLLSSTARDLPERHRSMRAVFDMTWQLLTTAEQQAFANLSIFQGGFNREAALQVANTSMVQLAALINKSLVRYDAAQNRYDLHELLRQYGRAKLDAIDDIAFEVADQHSAYYCMLLEGATDVLRTIGKPMTQTPYAIDFENVCQAWEWALRHHQVKRLQHIVDGFGLLLMRLVRYHEGKARFEQALKQWANYTPPASVQAVYDYVQAQLLIWGGDFAHFLGHRAQANTMLKQSLDILTRPSLAELDTLNAQTAALYCLGDTVHGEEAQQYYQQAFEMAQSTGDRWLEASTLQALSELYLEEGVGSLDQGKTFAEQSLSLHREIDDPWGIAWNLQTLTEIALNRRELIQAKLLVQESLQICQQLNLDSGVARCQARSGNIAFVGGEFDTALNHYRASLALWETLNLPGSAVHEQCRVAWTLLHQGKYKSALQEATTATHLFQDKLELNQAIDRAHYILGLQALAQDENSHGQRYFQLSLERTVWPRSRGYSLCGLALAEYRLQSVTDARDHLTEALDIAKQAEVYLLTLHTLNVATLLLAGAGAIDFARELYDQLIKHPFNANSRWVVDVVYQPLTEIFQTNDPADAAKCQWRVQTVLSCQKLMASLPASENKKTPMATREKRRLIE